MASDSEGSSEHDPYEGTHTDSDEDYVPANEEVRNLTIIQPPINSSSDEESLNSVDEVENEQQTASNTPQSGKKKLVRKALWKRNIQKTKRVKGEPYVNVTGINKPGQQIGNNCNCKLKCFDDIGHEGCTDIFRNFYGMSSKDLQDAYLYGLITRNIIQRQRPRSGDGHGKTSSFAYKVGNDFLALVTRLQFSNCMHHCFRFDLMVKTVKFVKRHLCHYTVLKKLDLSVFRSTWPWEMGLHQ